MIPSKMHPGMEAEWKRNDGAVVPVVVDYVFPRDGVADVLTEDGRLLTVDCEALRSRGDSLHPALMECTVRPLFCAACGVALGHENTTPRQLRRGGVCRGCQRAKVAA